MSASTIYLDLDRTLYRTTDATVAKWQVVSENYPGVDAATEQRRQREFYVYSGDAYAYDFSAHIASIGLPVGEVYAAIKNSTLADGRLEYDGVSALIDHARMLGDVQILTYGIDDYQRLKASLCPSLEGVSVVTTLRPKGEYLLNKGEVWLVDDKPLADQLPKNVRFIRVLHGKSVEGAVGSLKQVMLALN